MRRAGLGDCLAYSRRPCPFEGHCQLLASHGWRVAGQDQVGQDSASTPPASKSTSHLEPKLRELDGDGVLPRVPVNEVPRVHHRALQRSQAGGSRAAAYAYQPTP